MSAIREIAKNPDDDRYSENNAARLLHEMPGTIERCLNNRSSDRESVSRELEDKGPTGAMVITHPANKRCNRQRCSDAKKVDA